MSIENLIKERTLIVSDTKSSISRIAQSFKFDAIRDYNNAFNKLHDRDINENEFDALLELTNAQLDAETSILSLRAEIRSQI